MPDSPTNLLEDLRASLTKATAVVDETGVPVTPDAHGDVFDQPEGTIVIKISHTLRKRLLDRIDAVLATPTRRYVFACPHCGEPSAQVTDPELDIHAGATYTCAECDQDVIFEAMTPDEYVEQCDTQAASDDAFEKGRAHGERSTDGYTKAIADAAQAVRLIKFDDAKTRARLAPALLEDAAQAVEALATTPTPETKTVAEQLEGGRHTLHAKTLNPDGSITEDWPTIVKTDGYFMRATPTHDAFVSVVLDALENVGTFLADAIKIPGVQLHIDDGAFLQVGVLARPDWLAENERGLRLQMTFAMDAWEDMQKSNADAKSALRRTVEAAVQDHCNTERRERGR